MKALAYVLLGMSALAATATVALAFAAIWIDSPKALEENLTSSAIATGLVSCICFFAGLVAVGESR